jgi:23S rRNA (pseudouridine1915-N3)-methyltransferase
MREPLKASAREYEERAGRYWKLDVVEVEGGARSARSNPEDVMAAEGQRVMSRLPPGAEVISMTREGDRFDSGWLATYLQGLALHSSPGVAFVIGGAFGLGPEVIARSKRLLSLSDLTLPHELARVVLGEQLYRAGTIARGEPYHKG